jgi:hypothetical protein
LFLIAGESRELVCQRADCSADSTIRIGGAAIPERPHDCGAIRRQPAINAALKQLA